MEQDPTVFDYDGVYDSLQEQRELGCKKTQQSRDAKVVQREGLLCYGSLLNWCVAFTCIMFDNLLQQPRYIAKLKKAAEERKIEQELVFERKVQREREQEGDDFDDSEAFVTSAYRKKLEERAKMEERLKKEAKLEG